MDINIFSDINPSNSEKKRVAEEKAGLAEEKANNVGKEKEELQQLCDRLQAEMKLLPAEA